MSKNNNLIEILKESGLVSESSNVNLRELNVRKISNLYNKNSKFKEFLNKETEFLPKETITRVRWKYYVLGYKEVKKCEYCSAPIIKNIEHKFCSHECSTKVNNGEKRGPKIDIKEKELELKKKLKSSGKYKEYSVIKFGYPRSTFKHLCGKEFEADNYRLLNNRVKCECLHAKIIKHTIKSLKEKFKDTDWIPVEILEVKNVRFKNKNCGHYQIFAHDLKNKNQVCHTCHKKYTSNIVSHEEYLKTIDKDFELLSKYKNTRKRITYKHIKCGSIFKMSPELFKSRKYKCPHCAPKGRSSLYKHVIADREFYVRGKEAEALNWLAVNTNIDLKLIRTDFSKSIPVFEYTEVGTGKIKTYRPDLFIKNRNIIIEVKDPCSSGINGQNFFYSSAKTMWYTLCRKAKAVLAKGYKFRVLIFKEKQRIKLPKEWHTMSYSKIREWYCS